MTGDSNQFSTFIILYLQQSTSHHRKSELIRPAAPVGKARWSMNEFPRWIMRCHLNLICRRLSLRDARLLVDRGIEEYRNHSQVTAQQKTDVNFREQ
eukprot:scaffold7866_cov100-Skeletonema_dohrnii-CCMP3373.AAC.2